MKLNELKNTVPRKARIRVGRGDGSGFGRTAGRGEKGAGARTGYSQRPYFEGGQIPLIRRIPKRGFNHATHIEFEVVNVQELDANFEAGAEVTRDALLAKGLIAKSKNPLKILGDGELTKALNVTADRFSKNAKAKIEEKGGKCVDTAAK